MRPPLPLPILQPIAGRTPVDPIRPITASSPGQVSRHFGPEAKEKCGVVGVWGHPDAVRLTYLAMYAQQHRGQESAGIAVSDGSGITGLAGMGLVPDVFNHAALAALEAHAGAGAIGHNRYSTAGGSKECNAQPLVESYIGGQVAIAHNGNLINGDLLRLRFEEQGHIFHTTSDTEVIVHLLASPRQHKSDDALKATLRRLEGAFSLVMLFPDRIEAARDPWGWRPLVLGRLPDGQPAVASETVALDVIGARFEREVEPGEIVTLDNDTLGGRPVKSRAFAPPSDRLAMCVFEHVYFASPASTIFGQNVQTVRERLGERLAQEAGVEADFVMPMPDSGRSAAAGYARAARIPYREGIVPNRYVGRTFIKPTQEERRAAVRLKLNVISEIVRDKRLVVVDDSIVRGTTTREKMQQIREAGAKEIHLRISCPPIRHPCYFGVDFARRDELIAHENDEEAIRRFLGVDSLRYLSKEGMLACVKHAPENYCTACYDGDYRLDPDHPTTGIVTGSGQESLF
ncbi:MAG: amidophosphoribosyltransferase [Phycisphaerales bacterium]